MRVLALTLVALLGAAVSATAQSAPAGGAPGPTPQQGAAIVAPNAPATVCELPIPQPAKAPPSGSGPVVYQILLCFERQGGSSVIEANTYLYYIQLRGSSSSQDRWIPYNDTTEQTMLADFKRLWATNFLEDLSVSVVDYPFANGVIGKIVVYNMEERQRVKIVDYEGNVKVDANKIDEKLKEEGVTIRLDSFIDPGLLRRVAGVVRELYATEGYQFAEVKHEIKPVDGGPKLVHVTFHVT